MCGEKSDEVFTSNHGKKVLYPGYRCGDSGKRGTKLRTFGDYARWHQHLHALVADGVFLESGYFFVIPNIDLRPLRELFQAYVLKMLKKEGLIDDVFIKMLMSWRHVFGF